MEESYATQDRPQSQLEALFGELAQVHDLISTLTDRLSPVIHHGLKNAEKALAGSQPSAPNHVSTAVDAANAAARRLRDLIDSLAV